MAVDAADYYGFLPRRPLHSIAPPKEVPTARPVTIVSQVQESLGSDYKVTTNPDGTITATAKPVEYIAVKDTREKMVRRGQSIQKATFRSR
jgi:hypothetical protein